MSQTVPLTRLSTASYCAFRMVVSGVTGSEGALASGVGLVLKIIRMSVNEKFPQLMPSLYLRELATCHLPCGSMDANRYQLSG